MRSVSAATAALLANPPAGLKSADLFTFTLQDGVTTYRWTSYDTDIQVNGQLYSSRKPWLQRSRWGIENTLTVPTLELTLLALNDSFSGGIDIKGQLTNGLFDGATLLFDRIFFTVPTNIFEAPIVIGTPTFQAAANAIVSGWVSGPYPNDGQISIGLAFFDAAGSQIGSRQDSAVISATSSWVQNSTNATVPSGAARIRVFLHFTSNVLNDHSACFDDITLTVGGVAQTIQNPGAESGMASWTTSHGTVSSVTIRTDGSGFSITPHSGSYMFAGRTATSADYDEAYQDIYAAPDAVRLFGGNVANIDITGNSATINVKGKSNLLSQMAPRNLYQLGCEHAFCDAGCTLLRATFTAAYTVGSGSGGATRAFIPWNGTAPANASNYRYGTVKFTSGVCSGQSRTVRTGDSTGLTLTQPLLGTPAAGDSFTAFEGCDKQLNSSSGQDCTARSNTQNWRAFPYVPPADSAA